MMNDIDQSNPLNSHSKDDNLADFDNNYEIASQSRLMWWKFRQHRLAVGASIVLILMYCVSLSAEFFAPYPAGQRFADFVNSSPSVIYFVDGQGQFFFPPIIYERTNELDMETFKQVIVEDTTKAHQIRFFVEGSSYKLFGFIPTNIHFFGVDEPGILFLSGSDELGRDVFSRVLVGLRTSLFIGLGGVILSFVIGCTLGAISGYYGGIVDNFIQRLIEFLMAIPTLPLWMALSAAVPSTWSPLAIYFSISLVLSIVGWTSLARVVRGKILSLREEDYILAARLSGVKERQVILQHLLPGVFSYLIINLTLAIPSMILGETALSFLGLGIRPPAISLGALLQNAQNVQSVILYPWLLIPGMFVIAIVLAFNFVGDGLRDAADPYQ